MANDEIRDNEWDGQAQHSSFDSMSCRHHLEDYECAASLVPLTDHWRRPRWSLPSALAARTRRDGQKAKMMILYRLSLGYIVTYGCIAIDAD